MTIGGQFNGTPQVLQLPLFAAAGYNVYGKQALESGVGSSGVIYFGINWAPSTVFYNFGGGSISSYIVYNECIFLISDLGATGTSGTVAPDTTTFGAQFNGDLTLFLICQVNVGVLITSSNTQSGTSITSSSIVGISGVYWRTSKTPITINLEAATNIQSSTPPALNVLSIYNYLYPVSQNTLTELQTEPGENLGNTGSTTAPPMHLNDSKIRIFGGSPTDLSTINLSQFYNKPLTLYMSWNIPYLGRNAAMSPVQFSVTGGTSPYVFSATGVPGGLTFSSTGTLSGTPTTAGTYTMVVTVYDSVYNYLRNVNVSIVVSVITLTNTIASYIKVGAYSVTLTASGGTAPYTYSKVSGTYPTGFTLTSGGVFSGTAVSGDKGQSFTFVIRATDSVGNRLDTTFTVNITAMTLTLTPTPPNAVYNQFWYSLATTTGGTAPYTYTIDSNATSLYNLTVHPQTGVISGVISNVINTLTMPFTITVTDSSSPVTDKLSVTYSPSYTNVNNAIYTYTPSYLCATYDVLTDAKNIYGWDGTSPINLTVCHTHFGNCVRIGNSATSTSLIPVGSVITLLVSGNITPSSSTTSDAISICSLICNSALCVVNNGSISTYNTSSQGIYFSSIVKNSCIGIVNSNNIYSYGTNMQYGGTITNTNVSLINNCINFSGCACNVGVIGAVTNTSLTLNNSGYMRSSACVPSISVNPTSGAYVSATLTNSCCINNGIKFGSTSDKFTLTNQSTGCIGFIPNSTCSITNLLAAGGSLITQPGSSIAGTVT